MHCHQHARACIAHNLLSCSARDQRAALNAIKYLANKLRVSIVAAGTYEALHVMRSDPQIASRFEQHELPVWTESQELRRVIAGYLSLLPIKKAVVEIDKRFVEYLLELSDGVTGRIIEVLRRRRLPRHRRQIPESRIPAAPICGKVHAFDHWQKVVISP
jgi:hypothetical protein